MEHSSRITVPAGTDVRLIRIPLYGLVIAAPSPLKADVRQFFQPGLSGVLIQDAGLSWPDATGCAAASQLLANGNPVCFQFIEPADAAACHARLLAEMGR